MINNSTASTTLNVADIAPKAATVQPPRGDGAFSEALAGAHSVHDRRESRDAAGASRRDTTRATSGSDRTTGQDRADEVRNDASADRPGRAERGRGAERSDRAARAGDDDQRTTAATDDAAPVAEVDDAPVTDATEPTADAVDPTAVQAEAAATTQVAATVAVAAAPVHADLDAIVVPTTPVPQATTDAVDAAIRLAIGGSDAADTDADAVETTATTTAAAAPVVDAGDTEVDAMLAARGAEDAGDGDVQAGPTRPSTSTPTASSGPSPVQLAAATFTDAPAEQVDAPDVAAAAPQATTQVAVASGDAADSDAQLVQAAAVEVEGTEPEHDTEAHVDAAAPRTVKAEHAATKPVEQAAATTQQVEETDAPEVAQVARLTQQQAPTVSIAAQHQAAVQAKAAEQAAASDADAAAPAPAEPAPAQAAPVSATGRTDQLSNGIRVREGLLGAQQQARIDHIAEQLATRLRLSQAAGGSQVQLSLKPRELGDVTVHMKVREGVVAAAVLVDRPETLRTLQSNIDELKRSLEDQGLSIQEFSVDVRGDSGAGGANARAAADLNRNAARTSQGSSSSIAGAAAVLPGFDGDDVVTADDVHDGDVSVLA